MSIISYGVPMISPMIPLSPKQLLPYALCRQTDGSTVHVVILYTQPYSDQSSVGTLCGIVVGFTNVVADPTTCLCCIGALFALEQEVLTMREDVRAMASTWLSEAFG